MIDLDSLEDDEAFFEAFSAALFPDPGIGEALFSSSIDIEEEGREGAVCDLDALLPV